MREEGWDINFRRKGENSVRKKNCNDVKTGRDGEIMAKTTKKKKKKEDLGRSCIKMDGINDISVEERKGTWRKGNYFKQNEFKFKGEK